MSVSEWTRTSRSSYPLADARRYQRFSGLVRRPLYKKAAAIHIAAAPGKLCREGLGNVARDELRHLEHRDLGLASKYRLQFVVGIDLGPDLLVLKTVLFDIGPEFLFELCARQWGRANDGGECRVGRDRF